MNQLSAILFLIAIFLFSTFLNWYVFQAVRTLVSVIDGERLKNIIGIAYWIIFGGISLWLMITFIGIFQAGKISQNTQFMLNIFLTVFVTQLVCVVFLFGEDIFRNIQAGFSYLMGGGSGLPARMKWVSLMALGIAAIPFVGFIYGMILGKYNYKVHKEIIYFEELPEEFDGFTITQISDIHSGSFTDYQAIQKGIDLAIAQKSDLFVFTGDLVNHKAEEIEPMLEQFQKIKAPFGQFSILGNHDYGDYISWADQEEKAKNFEKLKQQHEKLGYRLLLDESVTLEKNGQKIRLLGVENWGVGFKKKGDLQKALSGTDKNDFKILLSHDPSHWDSEVKKDPNIIHLTLSGHTHGMQMGIETSLFRWSPVQYRYPNWAGLVRENNRFLYVNRGFGFHAFSGRVGIWPEITVIELRKS